MGEMSERQRNLIEDALEIEQRDAKKAGAMGYMTRALVQATLPHKDPKMPLGHLYSRSTGKLTMTVAPTSPRHGIPFGSIPRDSCLDLHGGCSNEGAHTFTWQQPVGLLENFEVAQQRH